MSGRELLPLLGEVMTREDNGLRTLRLGGNGPWGEGVAAPLLVALSSAACVVEELDVSGSGIGASDAASLVAGCRKLRTLTLDEWAMPIADLRSAEVVSSGGEEFGDAEGAVLGELLKGNTSLTKLELSSSSLSAEVLKHITNIVAVLLSTAGNALTTVRLGGNRPWAEGVAAPLIGALSSAACVVEELDLSGCALRDVRLALIDARCPLRILQLDGVPFGKEQSFDSLRAVLSSPCFSALQTLRMSGASLHGGVHLLCEALRPPNALQEVGLCSTGLDDEDALLLSAACDTRVRLDLTNNALSIACREQLPSNVTTSHMSWSLHDRHEWVALSDDQLEVRYAGGPSNNQKGKNGLVRAGFCIAHGTYYWEFTFPDASSSGAGYPSVGFVTAACPLGGDDKLIIDGAHGQGWGFYTDHLEPVHAGKKESASVSIDSKTRYGLLLDMDRGELSLYVNDVSQGVAFKGLHGKGALYPAAEAGTLSARRIRANFFAKAPCSSTS